MKEKLQNVREAFYIKLFPTKEFYTPSPEKNKNFL